MDDLIITSPDETSGIERLNMVLQVARDYGLEIKKKKCQILKQRVPFLGIIIENGEVHPSQEKTSDRQIFEADNHKTNTIVFRINGVFPKIYTILFSDC